MTHAPERPATPTLVKEQLSDKEIRRRKKALLGSKTGLMLAMLHGDLAKKREAIRKGKFPLGASPAELHNLITEILIVLVNVRDAYVNERCPVEAK